MKVCVIGDIHGTEKFLECYRRINDEQPDCDRIIVLGDHFDPYDDISPEECLEKYAEFTDIMRKDERVISILGNHDLSRYIISSDCTNRSVRNAESCGRIGNAVSGNLKDSYLCYRIGNTLFSHAGVSRTWLDMVARDFGQDKADRIMNSGKGWTADEVSDLTIFSEFDWSGYGDDVHQGCTWIRPEALSRCAVEGYDQVVGHTRVEEIVCVKMKNGRNLWLTDNMGKYEYLTLDIEESE